MGVISEDTAERGAVGSTTPDGADAALRSLEAEFRRYAASRRLALAAPYEALYHDHHRRSQLQFLRGGLLLAVVLLGGFLLIDRIGLGHYPDRVFAAALGIMAPPFVLALMFTAVGRLQPHAVTACCFVLLITGAVVAWAGVQVPGPPDQPPYMFGSCLIYVPFAYFFSGARFRIDTAIAATFSIECIALQVADNRSAETVLTSAYLMAAINAVGLVGRYILDRARRRDFLAGQLVRDLAARDALTGLYNRRVFHERLQELLARPAAGQAPVSVLLIDIDHFKRLNDAAGHAFGDAILLQTARVLATALPRPLDCAARLGGDEFGIIWTTLDAAAARTAAEALQNRLTAGYRASVSRWPDAIPGVSIGTSIGSVTVTQPEADDTVDRVLRRADLALYAAKRAGRAQIVSG